MIIIFHVCRLEYEIVEFINMNKRLNVLSMVLARKTEF